MDQSTRPRPSRREFLKEAAATAGAALAAPYVITSAALGAEGRPAASERIAMGAIGIGGRGGYIMGLFMGHADVQMVGVCEVRGDRRGRAKAAADNRYGNKDCKAYIDLRELLARDDLDAVCIATGENWHALASLLAARAGKDVYCEKPGSHTIAEGRALADAFRRYGRIYQGGTQRRSVGQFGFALHLARSGALGRIKVVRGEAGVSVPQTHTMPAEPQPPREQVDWDLFLGPAPWRPYNGRWLGAWKGDYDFQGGSIKEWGSHTADLCQLAADADHTSPVEYEQQGGDFVCRYANGAEMIFTRGLGQVGVRFEGDAGWVHVNDGGLQGFHPPSLRLDRQLGRGYPADGHVRNFLNCVKTRGRARSHAEAIHRSMAACHCADISLLLGRPMKWDPVKEEFIGDDEANRLRSRPLREPWRL